MACVTDRNGVDWHPRLDIEALDEIERRTGCYLLARPGIPDDAPGAEVLFRDFRKLIVAFAVCCAKERQERGVSVDELARTLNAGPLLRIAEAFQEELAAFLGMSPEELRERGVEGSATRPPTGGATSGETPPLPESPTPAA